jgi:hypothetical protein
MQLKNGSAIVSIASSRRPADWPWEEGTHFSVIHREGVNAFGGTPKAAGEDARAPQSICMDTAKTSQPCIAFHLPESGSGRRAR